MRWCARRAPAQPLSCATHSDLTLWISRPQKSKQLGPSIGFEPLVGHGEQPPAAIEGIDLAPPVSEGLVLNPPAAIVELAGVSWLSHIDPAPSQVNTPK